MARMRRDMFVWSWLVVGESRSFNIASLESCGEFDSRSDVVDVLSNVLWERVSAVLISECP
jgi:hypothetical protein